MLQHNEHSGYYVNWNKLITEKQYLVHLRRVLFEIETLHFFLVNRGRCKEQSKVTI